MYHEPPVNARERRREIKRVKLHEQQRLPYWCEAPQLADDDDAEDTPDMPTAPVAIDLGDGSDNFPNWPVYVPKWWPTTDEQVYRDCCDNCERCRMMEEMERSSESNSPCILRDRADETAGDIKQARSPPRCVVVPGGKPGEYKKMSKAQDGRFEQGPGKGRKIAIPHARGGGVERTNNVTAYPVTGLPASPVVDLTREDVPSPSTTEGASLWDLPYDKSVALERSSGFVTGLLDDLLVDTTKTTGVVPFVGTDQAVQGHPKKAGSTVTEASAGKNGRATKKGGTTNANRIEQNGARTATNGRKRRGGTLAEASDKKARQGSAGSITVKCVHSPIFTSSLT